MWTEISPLQHSAAWMDSDTFTILQYTELHSILLLTGVDKYKTGNSRLQKLYTAKSITTPK